VLNRTLRAAIRKNQHEPPSVITYSADDVTVTKKADLPQGNEYGRNRG
jgi:hypothetical protein